MELRITNMTATFAVNRNFNLQQIALKPETDRAVTHLWKRKDKQRPATDWTTCRVTYGRIKGFRSLRLKIKTCSKIVTALVYETGSIVLVGANKVDQLENAKCQILEHYDCKLTRDVKIANYAFSCRFPEPLNLDKMFNSAHQMSLKALYEPELFPCLLLSTRDSSVKAKVFKSGSVIITGCKNLDEGNDMYTQIVSLVKQ